MTPSDTSNVLPEAAAERLRRHLQQIASERDRAHRALQEREAELARIQRIAGVGGLEIDFRDGVKNRRSPEYLLVHGLPPEAANETYEEWVSRIHPEDRERTVQHLFGVLKSESEDYSAEYRIVRPNDGTTRWIRVVAKIERDRDGRALRLVGADCDVTPQMLAQATLRESEERFRLIAEQRAGAGLGHQARPHAFLRQPGLSRFPRAAVRGSHRVRLAQAAASGRPVAHRAGIGRGRGLAETVRAGGPLPARRRRMAVAALGIPAALGSDRQAYRLHRRRPRHHRSQAGRARFAPAERNPRIADHGADGAAGIQRSPDARDLGDQPSVSGAAEPARRSPVCQQDRACRNPL